jgi:hypothetical protein
MTRTGVLVSGGFLFVTGLVAGTLLSQAPPSLHAQQESQAPQYSNDVLEAYKRAHKSVRELNNLFVASGDSTTVFGGVNYFAASVGGINAERDLEEGRGVDPETFAALYAEMATPRIAQHLDFDEQGRLRYKKNVIRIYSRDRLKQLFQRRDQLDVRSEAGE